MSPVEGYQIKVPELVAPITISFEVTDDIELASVTVFLDGTELASYTDFKDYRRLVESYTYNSVVNGAHVVTVSATDKEGKQSSVDVNFDKVSAYTKKYDGEIFYMPFDGDFTEFISFKEATVVGSPGFAGEGVVGGNAYAGAADAYLTFPTDDLKTTELSATFWMKVDASPDRAGILVMGPEDPDNPDAQNVRTNGFRFFRENAGGLQRFKLNAGNGAADSWFDGGAAADVDPSTGAWHSFAFTISGTECVVYIDGAVAKQGAFDGIDWTGCDVLSIMSGAPRFTGWNHKSDNSWMDELRLYDKALTQAEIQSIFFNDLPYVAKYDGEIFYMPFEGNYKELISDTEATVIGTPDYADGKVGQAYAGAPDSYLTLPTEALQNSEFSTTFWMKINADPDRAGILVMGPEDPDNPDAQNIRTNGFRFFRENAGGLQRFKLNAGNGAADTWFDGGADADVDPTTGEWVNFAFTISGSECVVYIDGEVAKQGTFDGIDWTGCDVLSIMSGTPRFTGWNHKSDNSLMDELRIYDKALSQTEVQTIMNAD
jgi:hypothetical protein